MSRSGYNEDCDDNWQLIMWRGSVKSAIRGKRGQAFLLELIAALDALPEKKLISHELQKGGAFCAIGTVGAMRGVKMDEIDVEDWDKVAATFGIAQAMVREIEYENDEVVWQETEEARWSRMRAWAVSQLRAPARTADSGGAK